MAQNKNCKKGCDLKGNRSHDNGGIDAIVDDAGKTVEVESMEYIVCEQAVNDPNIHEYKGTNLQVVKAINKSGGGSDIIVTDADGKIVIETGQVVINKKSLSDNTVRSFKGTNKEILSQINQSMGNGVAIYENGGEVADKGEYVYHGTNKEFEKLDFDFVNEDEGYEYYGNALYFSNNYDNSKYYGEKKIIKIFIPNDFITKTIDGKFNVIRKFRNELNDLIKKGGIIKIKNVADSNMLGLQAKDFEYGSNGDDIYKYKSTIYVNAPYKRKTSNLKQMVSEAISKGINLFDTGSSYVSANELSINDADKLKSIGFNVVQQFTRSPKYSTTYIVAGEKYLEKLRKYNKDVIFSNGGIIKKGSTITHKGKEFEVIGASTGKLKAYLVKDKNGVESVIMDNQLHNDKYSQGGNVMETKATIHTGNKRVKAGELQIAYFKDADFPYKNKKVSSSKDAYDICKDIFSKNTIELQESFYALYLNRRNEIIAYEEISKGGTAGTVIDNKIILSIALKVLAHGIIIAHNHPSGNLQPSDSDINISKKLKSAATYMDISLLDSLIITNEGYYSLADEGALFKEGGTVNGYGYEDLSQKESNVVYENGGKLKGGLADKNLKDEIIEFFKKNNVDVDKLNFKYSKESRYQKNRYENAEEEVWVFFKDKKCTRKGKKLQTSFVLTRSEFESYKEMGNDGIDLLIYGNQLPLVKQKPQDQLKGGLADKKTIEDIAREQNENIEFAKEQLRKGIAVEMEHSDSRDIASEIALDHLSESINYYIELEKMEEKLENNLSEKYALGGTVSDENIIVNHNTYQNGIEIKFNSVPSYDVISKLKARGFRWSGRKKLWYNKYTESLFEWAIQPYAISENKNIQVEQNAEFEDEAQVLSLSNDEILLKQPQLKQIYDIVMNGALNFVQNAPPSSIEIKNRIFEYNESIKGFTHLPKGRKRPDKYSYGDIYRLCVLELLNYSIMMDIETALMSESGRKSDIEDLERIVKKHPYLKNAEGYNEKLNELQAIKEKAIAEYDMWNKWKATHLKKGQEVYAKDGNSIKQVNLGKSYGDNLDESTSFGYGRLDPAIVSCMKVDGWITSVYTFKLSNIYLENPQINLDAKNVIEIYGSPKVEGEIVDESINEENQNLNNLISIMNSKVKNQGYSLKQLYDEVIKLHGSRDGALIFSEFIKRKKDENDTDVINEFNKTSFVENVLQQEDWLFIGQYPTGVQYADKTITDKSINDYTKIAFVFDEKREDGSRVKVQNNNSKYESLIKELQEKYDVSKEAEEKPKEKTIKIGDTILYANNTSLRLLGVQELIKRQQYKVSEYKVVDIYKENGNDRIVIVNSKGGKITKDKYFDDEFKEIVRLSEAYKNNIKSSRSDTNSDSIDKEPLFKVGQSWVDKEDGKTWTILKTKWFPEYKSWYYLFELGGEYMSESNIDGLINDAEVWGESQTDTSETYYRLKDDYFGTIKGSIGLLVNKGEVVHKLLFGENQSGQKLIGNIDIYYLEEVANKVLKVKVGDNGYKFLEDGEIIEEITTDESPKEIEEEKPRISLELSDYENRYEINRAIERLLDEGRGDYSTDEKIFMMNYSGYGNLEKFGATGIGLKYEFFTPEKIVEKMWGLAVKYGYTNGDWLEPSVGNGRFIKKSPTPDKCWAYEINKYSALICQILYPNANIIHAPFETTFIKNNSSVKSKIGDLKKYDLVIGNPPYGELQGKYFGMGEKDSTKAGNFAEYFITRGLDLLNKDGLLIYIVGAELKNGGKLFLQGGKTKCKELISQKAILLDAYRLPAGLFESTNVETEIIVLKRK